MWTWICSACGKNFYGDTRERAESNFQAHARDVHHAKIVISMTGDE